MGSPFSTAMATATWPTLVHWLISCDLETLERNFMNILQNIAKVTIQDCDSVVIQDTFPCSISDVKISNTFDQKARNVVPDVEVRFHFPMKELLSLHALALQ
ncbi:hypothetical protein Tco_1545107 [Tanacetum coccineum]